jgi:hypothetical protein
VADTIITHLLSDDKFRLDLNHRLSKCLRELIKTRNKLVHIKETAVHLIGPNDQVRVENNGVIIYLPLPKKPWSSITLEKVKSFRESVDVYFREVLFPDSEEISNGSIVIAASS